MTKPPIKIIKPGRYTSVEGTEVSFTLADLEAAAASYDPIADPAPMVIGHPALDMPAYGWARALRVEDGHLVAEPDPEKTHAAFAEAVNAGRFPKVSGRFYLPTTPGNPKPGSLYLKHIGFLGAAAPAVKGLGTVSLADGAEAVTIETTPETDMTNNNTGTPGTVDFAEREAEVTRKEAALAEREREIETKAKAALHAANVSFAEAQIGAGKLAPSGKGLVVGILDQLEATETVSFGEADGEMAPAAAFRKLFDGAGTIVSFGEAAKPDDEKDKAGVSFAAPAGYDVDPKQLETHRRAVDLQAANPKLPYLDAVKQAG